jgi:hypothetical protein
VIKTRLQTQNMHIGITRDTSDEILKNVKYKDIISTFKTIIKKEGASGLAKGALPRSIQASLSGALSWVSYEVMKNLLIN